MRRPSDRLWLPGTVLFHQKGEWIFGHLDVEDRPDEAEIIEQLLVQAVLDVGALVHDQLVQIFGVVDLAGPQRPRTQVEEHQVYLVVVRLVGEQEADRYLLSACLDLLVDLPFFRVVITVERATLQVELGEQLILADAVEERRSLLFGQIGGHLEAERVEIVFPLEHVRVQVLRDEVALVVFVQRVVEQERLDEERIERYVATVL